MIDKWLHAYMHHPSKHLLCMLCRRLDVPSLSRRRPLCAFLDLPLLCRLESI